MKCTNYCFKPLGLLFLIMPDTSMGIFTEHHCERCGEGRHRRISYRCERSAERHQ